MLTTKQNCLKFLCHKKTITIVNYCSTQLINGTIGSDIIAGDWVYSIE